MIALLSGKLANKKLDSCIISVAGVGYEVSLSLSTYGKLPELGHETTLFIYTHVREDQFHLFGFHSEQEKETFKSLISISGVGPKMALSILSGLPAQELVSAISNQDLVRLVAIPGVGKKTAERIIVELKEKFKKALFAENKIVGSIQTTQAQEIRSALTNLGYPAHIAEKAVQSIPQLETLSLPDAIKMALKELR
ncbi:MAG: Holliday junction branch migration protein RuvA [Deltaproteobacteria bacterium CG11_big_fil_rev_8_21_14_0_20_42_23]|nr:MAG: Holliday junction branch migration protein RuvA [Deltaproteobacteria bacterium CG11_big_fil_rev_8_21_14_0_20_42_23]PJC64256.1 MAG: Holliday junction branch migration protein RuvA [Deltaproteobacteria bacterium CG_4_9_14_0_2_um_filter_42_21]